MKQHLGWLALASVLAMAGPAAADEATMDETYPDLGRIGHYQEVDPGVFLQVRGRAERQSLRMNRWIGGLEGAKAEVFDTLGVPNSRYYELYGNQRTEIWTYFEPATGEYTYHLTGTSFIFSGSELVQTRRF